MLTRKDLRGRMLDRDCYRAKISKYKDGPDDDRCFCYGLINRMTEDYLQKCQECGAFAHNAQPVEKEQR